MSLFQLKTFTSHSGIKLDWKVDCDYLADEDIKVLAHIGRGMIPTEFGLVLGVPRGGLRLASALTEYITKGHPTKVVVDDVLTTGKSIRGHMALHEAEYGLVIFNRGNIRIGKVYSIWNIGGHSGLVIHKE